MWDWINCHLMARHDDAIWCEKNAIYLRCIRCGRRSSGWRVQEDPARPPVASTGQRRGVQMRLVSGSAGR
ncbi:MAG: hypothetical protein ACE148_09405 [Vicinamibacterales bacterium]